MPRTPKRTLEQARNEIHQIVRQQHPEAYRALIEGKDIPYKDSVSKLKPRNIASKIIQLYQLNQTHGAHVPIAPLVGYLNQKPESFEVTVMQQIRRQKRREGKADRQSGTPNRLQRSRETIEASKSAGTEQTKDVREMPITGLNPGDAELFRIAQQGGIKKDDRVIFSPETLAARERIAQSHEAMAKDFAHQNSKGRDFQEVYQDARIGILHAMLKFEPQRRIAFSTYAHDWMKQSINREAQTSLNQSEGLPYNVQEKLYKLKKIGQQLQAALAREPTDMELMEESVRSDLKEKLNHDPKKDEIKAGLEERRKKLEGLLALSKRKFQSLENTLGPRGEVIDFGRALGNAEPGYGEVESDDALERILARAEGGLTENQKRVIRGRFSMKETLEEIAEELGTNAETVRKMQIAALKKIETGIRRTQQLPATHEDNDAQNEADGRAHLDRFIEHKEVGLSPEEKRLVRFALSGLNAKQTQDAAGVSQMVLKNRQNAIRTKLENYLKTRGAQWPNAKNIAVLVRHAAEHHPPESTAE